MPYLKLWHGRQHPEEQVSGWGEDGPTFGPFPFFQTTYGCEIKFGDEGNCLEIVEGFVYYDGMYYGDWSFCDQLDGGMQSGLGTFDTGKAVRANPRANDLPLCGTLNGGGFSGNGTNRIYPQVTWQELMDAFHQLEWESVRDFADGLLQWMDRGGLPPTTSTERKSVDGVRIQLPRTPSEEWNRTVAQAACRYALDLANQVLKDPDGIPHGVPFTLSCCKCDIDGPGDYHKAVNAGWFRIRFVPQNMGENFIGLCPDCE